MAEKTLSLERPHQTRPQRRCRETLLEGGQLGIGPEMLRGSLPEGVVGEALQDDAHQVTHQCRIFIQVLPKSQDRLDVLGRALRVAHGQTGHSPKAESVGHGFVQSDASQRSVAEVGGVEFVPTVGTAGRLGDLLKGIPQPLQREEHRLRGGHVGRRHR